MRINTAIKSLVAFTIFACNITININAQTIDLSGQTWKLWLDEEAEYWNDELFLPPFDISQIESNKPTCGWENIYQKGIDITVPATVEEYFWGKNGNSFGASGDYAGVSWFTTNLFVPDNWEGKLVSLEFHSIRLRAEIYINNKLVGYDLINGSPFDVDITKHVEYGKDNKLAVRITDPDGNFLWIDFINYNWGKYKIPPSHAFGGITDKVELIAKPKTNIHDIFIKNKPEITSVDVELKLENVLTDAVSGNVDIKICPWKDNKKAVYSNSVPVSAFKENHVLKQTISIPKAKPWSPDSPNLYVLTATWKSNNGETHEISERFGFRWFEPKTIDGERMFFLNNKRIVLRTSISWGFWPVNGIYPTPELAKKQIQTAKDLGLNMLNFHRGIGQTMILDLADEMGLLYYEEPGGYKTGKFGEFTQDWNREKMLRMIRRDRNHPSLIIYNMINESNQDPLPHEYEDIKIFHEADPTRVITFTSTNLFKRGSYKGINPEGVEAGLKLHMLPYDTTRHIIGWWDQHFPSGPGVYMDEFYSSPQKMHKSSHNKAESVMWGEDGAIGTPHRLVLMKKDIEKQPRLGWDGDSYLSQYKAYDEFLDNKGFREAFPTVDVLTTSLGENAMYYQSRMIENIRINNNVDCYVVNGWEGEKIENHSGIVDIYRNPKADPKIMAHYNQPLFIGIKARNLVFETGQSTLVDFFIVNEKNLNGKHLLKITVQDEKGQLFTKESEVTISGGSVYGELLLEGIEITTRTTGYCTIEAQIKEGNKIIASGFEKLFTTTIPDWNPEINITVADTSADIDSLLSKVGISDFDRLQGSIEDKGLLIVNQAIPPFHRTNMFKRQEILEWVKRGNTMLVLKETDKIAEWLADKEVIDYRGRQNIGKDWYGGNYIVKEHPLFKELPINTAFNWEYQCLADYKKERYGLRIENGETVVAVSADHKPEMYSSVVVIPYGKGRIILSTLDLNAALLKNKKSAIVAKKILMNFIEYGTDKNNLKFGSEH